MPDDLPGAAPPATTRMGLSVPSDIPTDGLPLTLRIMLNPEMFARLKEAAAIMSRSEGFVGRHLLSKPEACFAVLTRAMDWHLDPYFVAMATYQTPNGQVGFEGKLCQAILENSGRFVGGIRFEHHGDWDNLVGKFKIEVSAKGHEIPKPTWTREKDAIGLGVTVIGHVRGEAEPRRWTIELAQAYPLNSPLWATDPRSQICYLAVRRFGDLAAPGIYGGVRFNVDEFLDASETARDVTHETMQEARPTAARETRTVVEAEAITTWQAFDAEGDGVELKSPEAMAEAIMLIFTDAAKRGEEALDTAYENNRAGIDALRDARHGALADEVEARYDELVRAFPAAPEQQQDAEHEAEETGESEPTPLQEGVVAEEDAARADLFPPPEKTAAAPTQQAAEKTAAAPTRADPFWGGESLTIEIPQRQNGSSNWPAYADYITRLIGGAPTARAIDSFKRANQRALSSLRVSYSGGYDEFDEAATARRRELP